MSDLIQTDMLKRGEVAGQISFDRLNNRIVFCVKLVPAFEQLMASWGSGESIGVTNYGREWATKQTDPLRVYDMTTDPGVIQVDGQISYLLNAPGRSLVAPGTFADTQLVNLSFLRLVGTSGPAGVSFDIKGMHSLESLRKWSKNIRQAMGAFYQSYLLPVNMTIVLQTTETKI